MKKICLFTALIILIFGLTGTASAIPALQIYIEGSSYDISSETWLSGSPNFILWVLGDVGHYGNIADVRLITAYPTSETGSISLIPTNATAGLLPWPYDPSVPAAPIYSTHGDGTIPTLNNGSNLPSHGIYGAGTSWDNYALGDFTLTDSPIGDYIYTPPTSFPDMGQINAYKVKINGYSWVHFDAFDHYTTNNGRAKYVFAPLSHDANAVPEPASLSLLGLGLLLGLAGLKRKHA